MTPRYPLLFKEADRRPLRPYNAHSNDEVSFAWEGKIHGIRHRVTLDRGTIRVNKLSFRMKTAKAFPDETTHDSDLGRGTEAFFARDYVCLESTPASASGTAVRHKSVYLIRTIDNPGAFKLPSLFASCLGIRLANGQPVFDKVEYRHEDNNDLPIGVTFLEHSLRGDEFVATGQRSFAKFVEPDNVYRFSVEALRK